MALKIGSLNLNLKTVQPKVTTTIATVIGFDFTKTNTAKLVEMARQGKVTLSVDEVNALVAMLPVFDSPDFNPKVAISGSVEMAAIISKAAPIFNKGVSFYWERNFTSFVFNEETIEKETLEVVVYLRKHFEFFLGRNFRPQSGGTVPMKTADYVLNEARKLLSHFEKTKVPAKAAEVWDFLTGALKSLFETIQQGRKLSSTYKTTGALIELSFNTKPTSTVELGMSETTKAFLFVQQQFAESNQRNSHKSSPIFAFAEEETNENPLKNLLSGVVDIVFNTSNFGTQDQLIENAIEEANEEFEDSFEGLHRNSPASQTMEIAEPTVPTSKKGK